MLTENEQHAAESLPTEPAGEESALRSLALKQVERSQLHLARTRSVVPTTDTTVRPSARALGHLLAEEDGLSSSTTVDYDRGAKTSANSTWVNAVAIWRKSDTHPPDERSSLATAGCPAPGHGGSQECVRSPSLLASAGARVVAEGCGVFRSSGRLGLSSRRLQQEAQAVPVL